MTDPIPVARPPISPGEPPKVKPSFNKQMKTPDKTHRAKHTLQVVTKPEK